MYAYPPGVAVAGAVGGGHTITLAANGNTFSESLPASLQGLVSPHEFAASVRRCNAAYQSGPLWLARLIMLLGLVAWVICLVVAFQSSDFGPNPAMMAIAFACLVVSIFGGSVWSYSIVRGRLQKLQNAVAQENEVYNNPARRAAAPNQPPISWSLTILSTGWYYRRNTFMCQINIQVGGPYLAGPVVVVAQPGQPQQQQPPQYQPYSGQAYQATYAQPAQPVYGAPVSGQPGAGPVVYQPQPPQNPHRDSSREPLLADNSTAEGYGGHEQAAAPVVATCSRCGRTTANQEDRFCASCGGQYVR